MHESHIEIRLADWKKDNAALSAIRSQVFIKEQNVPEDMEWDEFDATASHFLVLENNQAIACARLKSDGQIGRMAVLHEHRGKDTGKKLLQLVLQTASEKNLKKVYLHAQVSAITFYEKHGFISQGEIFYEANIAHRAMTKKIPIFHKLGETVEEVYINTAEENKNAAISLVRQARYSIDIFTQDMDAELYNNNEFEKLIFKLAKKHPNTKIRTLAQDTSIAVKNGHRLIRLAQHLTSSVFINKPSREYKNEKCAFLIVDKIGVLYRTTANHRNYKASFNFMSPQRAGKLTDFFNDAWEHSTPDIQTRRIYM